ncbi:MAG TPA: molybdate ABC transporter substrate-binding protein [Ilumatobacter sp.]|nr:molybdate ABC transporter substrate-binding protein [Ilumatobacter sp.]
MPRHHRYLAPLAAVGLVLTSCGSDDLAIPTSGSDVAGDVTVFAAASLTAAFTEIGAVFEAEYPEAAVVLNFAGSSDLVAQILQSAPADVFASADTSNMDRLVSASGHATEPSMFATNVAEIIVQPGNPLGITGVVDLANDDLIVVQCAPEVPCGRYAAEIYANAGVAVIPKSYEENVNAVVTKVRLGEADAGIVYATDVIGAGDAAQGVAIPADANVIAEYPIAAVADAANLVGAQAFVDFVLAAESQSILAAHGFRTP